MPPPMPLPQLLAIFTVKDLGDALYCANEPLSGSKDERIQRLVALKVQPGQLLDFFNADALRAVCSVLELPTGRKADMVTTLVSVIQTSRPVGVAGFFRGLVEAVSGPPQAPLAAPAAVAPIVPYQTPVAQSYPQPPQAYSPQPQPGYPAQHGYQPPIVPIPVRVFYPPTRDAVAASIQRLVIPRRRIREESDATEALRSHLSEVFENVHPEYYLGGYLGLKIDLDIGNGKLGIEVKLASALLKAAEAHRLVGQVTYYQRRRYGDALLVAIVGNEDDLTASTLKELTQFLSELGIVSVPVRLVS
jgi:hypothetical protein